MRGVKKGFEALAYLDVVYWIMDCHLTRRIICL